MSNGDLDWDNENTWNAMLDRSVVLTYFVFDVFHTLLSPVGQEQLQSWQIE